MARRERVYRLSVLIMPATLLFIVAVAGAHESAANAGDELSAPGIPPVRYAEIPGQREFSGQMITRPVQPEVWADHGLSSVEAAERMAAQLAAIARFALRTHVRQTDEYVFHVPGGSSENQVAADLMATGDFEYVEPNWIVYPIACPNDPFLLNQWHHNADRMRSCDAWDISTGVPTVGVGICDTGVLTTHEDLQLNRRDGYNAVDQLWESAGGDISPVHSHGTQTTGCAAANGNNAVGVSGVGWNLSHRMMRVSNLSTGSTDMMTLTHAARTSIEAGDRVASVSYSGVTSASVQTTAAYIKSINGLLVWAAGNDGIALNNNDRDADDVIVVGATDSTDLLAFFSNSGTLIDLVAPGVSVYTTSTASDSSYAAVSGTSFACPLTAGLVAMIWSANPSMTPDEVENALKSSCDDLGAAGIDNTYGYGRINLYNAMVSVAARLQFTYPDGLPALIDPDGGTTVRVEVAPQSAVPQPGTGMLHYDDGAGFVSIPMNTISDNVYDAVFPAMACGADVSFFFTAENMDGQTVADPLGAPNSGVYSAFSALDVITIMSDNFETDQGWTAENLGATSGDWQRGVPVNDPLWDFDPLSDADGSGSCYLTQNVVGNTDVDNGAVRLTSPAINMAQADAVRISYDYFLKLTDTTGGVDLLLVEINNNNGAGAWIEIARHDTDGGLSWRRHTIEQTDLDAAGVTRTSMMKLRFTANDADPQSINESGLDAFVVTGVMCADGPPAAPTGLAAAAGDVQVDLNWNDNTEPDLDGYNVYRSETCGGPYGPPINSALLASSDFVDNDVVNGTPYFYVVTAVDAAGNESGISNEASATPDAGTVNLATADQSTKKGTLTGSFTDTHVQDHSYERLTEQLSSGKPIDRHSLLIHTWTFSVAAGSTYTFFVDAYHTLNAEGDDFEFSYSRDNVDFVPMLTVTKTADDDSYDAFVFLENIAGTLYVRVEDSDRTSRNQFLDTLFVDHMYVLTVGDGGSAGPPAAPTGLAATPGNGQVSLDWADNTEPDLAGYNVHRAAGGGPYVQINGALVLTSEFVDNDVVNGTTYYYVVTAVDDSTDESGNSNEASATPGAPADAIVDCITYTTSGGRNGDRNMIIAVSVVDDFDNGLADATVSISIEQDFGSVFGWLEVASASGATNSSGVIQFLAKNFPNACYRTVITQIDAGVLVFDGSYPANSFCKGTDPTPNSHCR